jgi:uncharacterized protein YraI
MKLRLLATAALGLGMAFAIPAVAEAYTSYTTGAVNFRSGPGVGYASYGSLPAGTAVNVQYCQPGWCRASSFLGTGWVSSSYLSSGAVYPRVYPRPDYRPYPAYPPSYRYPYYRHYDYYPRSSFGFFFGWP